MDRYAHFGACLPALDGPVTLILQNIIDDQALASLENMTGDPPDNRVLKGLHSTLHNVLACSAKAADCQIPLFVGDEDCSKFISKITRQQFGSDQDRKSTRLNSSHSQIS